MCTFYQDLYASIYECIFPVSLPAQPAPQLTSEAVLPSRPADLVAASTMVISSGPPILTVSRSFSADITSVPFPVDSAAIPSTTDQPQPPSSRSPTVPPATDQPQPPSSRSPTVPPATDQPQPPSSGSTTLPSPTNQLPPPSSRSSTVPPATDQPPPLASGLNSGGIVAIVIMVLALVVSVTVAVGLIVCFVRRHRHHQFRPKRANKFPAIGMCGTVTMTITCRNDLQESKTFPPKNEGRFSDGLLYSTYIKKGK